MPIARSLGAALGPLLTSYLSQTQGGFNSVFYMLYASSLAAAVLLSRLVINEVPPSRDLTLAPSQLNRSKNCAHSHLPKIAWRLSFDAVQWTLSRTLLGIRQPWSHPVPT